MLVAILSNPHTTVLEINAHIETNREREREACHIYTVEYAGQTG